MTDDIDNNTIPLISDQLLEAYVDGQLDSETERRVENLIANDQTLRDKALHMMGLREGLRRAVTERAGMPASMFSAFRTAIEVYHLSEQDGASSDRKRHRRLLIERVLTRFQAIPKADLEYLLEKLDALEDGRGAGVIAPAA